MLSNLSQYASPYAGLRSWVEIDLTALVGNAEYLYTVTGKPIMPVVKANAYGHGAAEVAKALLKWGEQSGKLSAFVVATMKEAIDLKSEIAGSSVAVFCCTPPLSTEIDDALKYSLVPALHRAEDIERWGRAGNLPWQLSIDTGMQRAGIRWDSVGNLRDVVAAFPPAGVFTHFYSAESDEASMHLQEQRFNSACDLLGLSADTPRHIDNSAAIAAKLSRASVETKGSSGAHSANELSHSEFEKVSCSRPGVALYGGMPGRDLPVRHVASVRARVLDIHELQAGDSVSYGATFVARSQTTVATLAIGYADGFRRAFSNVTQVLMNGVRVPVVGVVTMDMIMIDITGVSCSVGDVATIIGSDSGETILPGELATAGGLSVYELFIGMQTRMPRFYLPN